MHRSFASAVLVALIATACAGGASVPPGPSVTPQPSVPPSFPDTVLDAATLTAYDPAAPLDVRDEAEPRMDGDVAIHDVSWASPLGGRVAAWLVVPPGEGPFAGLVYLHGTETWRDDFLDEAVAMAHGGAVSLVLDAPFARAGEDRRLDLQEYEDPAAERLMTAQAIVDVRRACDLLGARDDVDADRLGYVGHSWGASLGIVLAAVDPRPAAIVAITGRPSWTGFLATSEDPWVVDDRERVGEAQWQAYLDLMAPLDAMAEIDAVDGSRLYLQYGTADNVVPEPVARELVEAAGDARTDWYDAGHALDDAATADRVAWIVERLGLAPIDAAVIGTVGLPDE